MTTPWEKTVEVFEATGTLKVKTREMTLRQAVECYVAMPEDAKWSIGVGIHELTLMTMYGRPVAVGFLNADGLAELAQQLPIDGEDEG